MSEQVQDPWCPTCNAEAPDDNVPCLAHGDQALRDQVEALWNRWGRALDNGCPSCGPHIDDCDHIEGYHHAYSDLAALLTTEGAGA